MNAGDRSLSFVQRFQIPIFFVLAYALTWLVWGTYLAEQAGLLAFHLPEALFAYFALTLAVLIVAGLAGARPPCSICGTGCCAGGWGEWYALALLVPIALPLITAGLYTLAGGAVPMGVDLPLGAALIYFFTLGRSCGSPKS